MLVFIYHLKTSFEQGHLIEEFLSRYRDVLWLRFSMLQFKQATDFFTGVMYKTIVGNLYIALGNQQLVEL